jgi:hypothetical protein
MLWNYALVPMKVLTETHVGRRGNFTLLNFNRSVTVSARVNKILQYQMKVPSAVFELFAPDR